MRTNAVKFAIKVNRNEMLQLYKWFQRIQETIYEFDFSDTSQRKTAATLLKQAIAKLKAVNTMGVIPRKLTSFERYRSDAIHLLGIVISKIFTDLQPTSLVKTYLSPVSMNIARMESAVSDI